MKNFIVLMLFLGFLSSGHAQKIVRLDELKMTYSPAALKVSPNTNSISFIIPEAYNGEFTKNPLLFVYQKFDISDFIEANKKSKFDSYQVSFRSLKGYLNAEYDKHGNMQKANHVFKDVKLPNSTVVEVLKANKGWSIAGNKHVAFSKEWNIEKEYYKIKLENGNKKKVVRIDLAPSSVKEGVAGIN